MDKREQDAQTGARAGQHVEDGGRHLDPEAIREAGFVPALLEFPCEIHVEGAPFAADRAPESPRLILPESKEFILLLTTDGIAVLAAPRDAIEGLTGKTVEELYAEFGILINSETKGSRRRAVLTEYYERYFQLFLELNMAGF